jgi:serine/threonine-protein kinase
MLAILECRAESDHYGLLGLPPEADEPEIASALERITGELDRMRAGADEAQRARVEEILGRLSEVRRVLGEPGARASYDAGRGNFQGVARALRAGLSPQRLDALHTRFAQSEPDRVQRATSLLPSIDHLLQQGERMRALELLHQALALDPLSRALQQRYQSLRRAPADRAGSHAG